MTSMSLPLPPQQTSSYTWFCCLRCAVCTLVWCSDRSFRSFSPTHSVVEFLRHVWLFAITVARMYQVRFGKLSRYSFALLLPLLSSPQPSSSPPALDNGFNNPASFFVDASSVRAATYRFRAICARGLPSATDARLLMCLRCPQFASRVNQWDGMDPVNEIGMRV